MTGLVVESEPVSQGAKTQIGYFVDNQPPGQSQGVDHFVGESGSIGRRDTSLKEGHVERDVVSDEDGVADELKK